MKRFGWIFLGLTALSLFAACSREPDTANVSGNVKVRIPFPDESGNYSLQVIGLSGITSLYEFSGQYANFFLAPSAQGNKLRGPRPRAHFTKAGDVYVPQDTDLSQQMAVIYAHLERLSVMDSEMGVGDLQQGPRDVGMMVRYATSGKSAYDLNNAFYNPDTDSILLVPFTANELPLAVNGGVLAHEHFHSLYFKLVGRRLGQKAQGHGHELKLQLSGASAPGISPDGLDDAKLSLAQKTNLFFYLGLNEGLADFWAWTYTGDPDFLKASVPQQAEQRSLKVNEAEAKELTLSRVGRWRGIVGKMSGERCSIYCLGTEYSRTLREFARVVETSRGIISAEARKVVAKAVLTTLPALAVSLKELKEDEFFEPANFLKLLDTSMEDAKPAERAFLNGVLNRTLGVSKANVGSVTPNGVSGVASPAVAPTPLPVLGAE